MRGSHQCARGSDLWPRASHLRHGQSAKGAELSRPGRQLRSEPDLRDARRGRGNLPWLSPRLQPAKTGSGRAVFAASSEENRWEVGARCGTVRCRLGPVGILPRPAITSLPLLAKGTLLFVPAMLIGIGLVRLLIQTRLSSKAVSASATEA